METITLNNELNLTCPKGFHLLSEAELEEMGYTKKGPGESISDEEGITVISFGWRSAKGFSFVFLKAADIAHHDEKLVMKQMKDYGYLLDGFTTRQIGGENAESFRYGYNFNSERMAGESLVLKHNKTFYYIHFHTKDKLKAEQSALWEELLRSVTFK